MKTKLKVLSAHMNDEMSALISDDKEFGIVWDENCYRVELTFGDDIMSFGPFATIEAASRWVGPPLDLWTKKPLQ